MILVALTGGGLTTVVATAVVTIPSTIHSTVPGTSALLGYSHFTDGTTEAQSRYPGSRHTGEYMTQSGSELGSGLIPIPEGLSNLTLLKAIP